MDRDMPPRKVSPDGLLGALKELTAALLLGIARGNDFPGARIISALNECQSYMKEADVSPAITIEFALSEMNEKIVSDPTISSDFRVHSDLTRSALRLTAYLIESGGPHKALANSERTKIERAIEAIATK